MTEPELLKKLKDVEGRLCPGQEYWLYQKVLTLPKDAKILEIGTLHGRSACAMGFACVDTSREIFTMDKDAKMTMSACENFMRLNLQRWIGVLLMNSLDLHRKVICDGCAFEFSFIDGDHDYDGVENDFREVCSRMKPGGIVALHDVTEGWPDVQRFWQDVASKELTDHEFCHSIASGRVQA